MKLLYVTSEAYPFCKTGGLADVASSLPPALAAEGVETAVILPLYDKIGPQWREKMTFRRYIYVDLGWRHEYCGLFSLYDRGVTWYFVDNEKYFRRGRLYGEFDDGERFAFFQQGRRRPAAQPGLDAGHPPLQRLADGAGTHLSQGRGHPLVGDTPYPHGVHHSQH